MTVGIRILVWKKGTSRVTSDPDYTIDVEGGETNLLFSLVTAIEKIADALREKGDGPK